MRRRTLRTLSSIVIVASLASSACDGTGGAVLTRDGGWDGGPRPTDAARIDDERPRVVGSDPREGATAVRDDVTITVELSEPMDPSVGTIRVEAGGTTVDTVVSWDATGTELTIDPRERLPSEGRVRVVLEDDLADLAGNTLALPFVLSFEVGDARPPVVVTTEPAQGATGLSARLEVITIEFDELMDASAGTVRLEGGVGTLEGRTWLDGRTLRVTPRGLAYETSYRVVLEGFADASGNALDRSVYLDDGALEIATAADVDPPRVLDSVPAEGQINVALRGTPSITIVFDEPMDTAAGAATLHVAGLSTELVPAWSAGGTRLSLAAAGRLYPNATHAVELAGFRDRVGNALDLGTYLGDGRLDFDTGADATVPIVVFSYPGEGSTDSDHTLASIRVVFDRAMDTGVTELRVDDGVASFDAPLTWNLAGTQAVLDVAGRIHAGRDHRVDLRGVVDLAGDPVDPAAPYLGDGALDFATRTRRGEQCRDELTIAEATATLPSGGHEWVIAESTMAIADNGPVCRYDDTPSPGHSADAVIVYRKTTASGSSGGRYLRVVGETAPVAALTPNRMTLAVYRDACGEASVGGPEGRLTCQWDRYRWEQYLDVGAGDYYVWVAATGTTLQEQITVRIEEVDAVAPGETCGSPLTTATPAPVYTAPAMPGGEHVWTVDALTYHGADMDDAWPGDGAIACDEEQVQGADFVIRYDKVGGAESLVSVVVEPLDSGTDAIHVEALSGCDPRAPGAPAYASMCGLLGGTPGVSRGPRRMTFAAPPGPLHLWIANDQQRTRSPGVRVRVHEIDDLPGSSCANALPLPASGSTSITPSSPARTDVPSCFRGAWDEGVTWYRLTSTASATIVRADVDAASATAGALAIVDAASERELGCTSDAASVPQLALLAPGSDVCVAVRNGSGVTRLDTAQVAYTGVRGVPTDLGILRPLDATGIAEQTITADTWMALTPTTLYMALSTGSTSSATNGVVVAPLAGGARATYRDDFTLIGNGGVAVGEALWSLDDATAAGAAPRLHRLADPSGAWGAVAWDGGMSWPGDGFDAIASDGTSLLVVNDYASTSLPVQLRTFDPAAAGASSSPITIDAALRNVVAIAADATWLYLAGAKGSGSTLEEGVYRIRRTELGTASAEWIANVDVSTIRAAMVIDSATAASHLYVRDDDGSIHAIASPGGAPVHLGIISTLGTGADVAMAYEPVTGSLYVFETETVSTGRFVRLD